MITFIIFEKNIRRYRTHISRLIWLQNIERSDDDRNLELLIARKTRLFFLGKYSCSTNTRISCVRQTRIHHTVSCCTPTINYFRLGIGPIRKVVVVITDLISGPRNYPAIQVTCCIFHFCFSSRYIPTINDTLNNDTIPRK